MEIDGKLFLKGDLSLECWTKSHIQFAIAIIIPFSLVWVIAFPLLVFKKLYKNRKNFNNSDFLKQYGLFFVGLKDESYFWELLINNARKIIFIMIGSLFSAQQIYKKVMTSKFCSLTATF